MTKNFRTGFLVAAAIGIAVSASIVDAEAQNKTPKRVAESAPHRAAQYPRVGRQVRTLPQGHRTIRVDRQSYRYYNGSFYRPGNNGVYVVVRAPIGARVNALPPGYLSFGIGARRYFYVNYTYFLWDRDRSEYVVVVEPEGAEETLVTASETTSSEIFVYPNQGQSDEQRDRDRYECYLWASGQTGYDPGAGDPDTGNAGDYRRALSACLEGRGYTVK
ncbi:MAG: DUF6515 family protein [Woeseia sp.]